MWQHIKYYMQDEFDIIYVDDIIFGGTNQTWSKEFAKCTQGEFEISMIGELIYFSELQIKQSSKTEQPFDKYFFKKIY